MTWLDKHTFPRLARSTLNELQENQHEKASLVCVRVQSPSGLSLVPCALSMVDVSGQLLCWIRQRQTSLVQKNDFNFNFWHPTLVRPARKRLFCLKAKNGLGRFAPSPLPHYNSMGTVGKVACWVSHQTVAHGRVSFSQTCDELVQCGDFMHWFGIVI